MIREKLLEILALQPEFDQVEERPEMLRRGQLLDEIRDALVGQDPRREGDRDKERWTATCPRVRVWRRASRLPGRFHWAVHLVGRADGQGVVLAVAPHLPPGKAPSRQWRAEALRIVQTIASDGFGSLESPELGRHPNPNKKLTGSGTKLAKWTILHQSWGVAELPPDDVLNATIERFLDLAEVLQARVADPTLEARSANDHNPNDAAGTGAGAAGVPLDTDGADLPGKSEPIEQGIPPRGVRPAIEATPESPLRINLLDLLDHLEEAACVVLQGPPGCGKTWRAEQLIKAANGGEEKASAAQWSAIVQKNGDDIAAAVSAATEPTLLWELVQLHPGYAYEDFVRGMTMDKHGKFVSQDRLFLELCWAAARRGPNRPTLLVLDEVNRCNLSSVLGELIAGLEKSKRGKLSIRLQYPPPKQPPWEGEAGAEDRPGHTMTVPAGLWIIATMNTADRSIALVDYAIRRRFRFLDLQADERPIEAKKYHNGASAQAVALFKKCRALLGQENEHLAIGHSYFLIDEKDRGDWALKLARRFVFEVAPLLREYQRDGLLKVPRGEATDKDDEVSVLLRELLSPPPRPESSPKDPVEVLRIWLDRAPQPAESQATTDEQRG